MALNLSRECLLDRSVYPTRPAEGLVRETPLHQSRAGNTGGGYSTQSRTPSGCSEPGGEPRCCWNVAVTCHWGSGRRRRNKAWSECWRDNTHLRKVGKNTCQKWFSNGCSSFSE